MKAARKLRRGKLWWKSRGILVKVVRSSNRYPIQLFLKHLRRKYLSGRLLSQNQLIWTRHILEVFLPLPILALCQETPLIDAEVKQISKEDAVKGLDSHRVVSEARSTREGATNGLEAEAHSY